MAVRHVTAMLPAPHDASDTLAVMSQHPKYGVIVLVDWVDSFASHAHDAATFLFSVVCQ